MTYDEFVQIALQLPGTEEGVQYRGPAIKREGRTMLTLLKDGETVSIRLDWANRDRLLSEHPEVFTITPHHEPWPSFLISLPALSPDLALEVLRLSYDDTPNPYRKRR